MADKGIQGALLDILKPFEQCDILEGDLALKLIVTLGEVEASRIVMRICWLQDLQQVFSCCSLSSFACAGLRPLRELGAPQLGSIRVKHGLVYLAVLTVGMN